MTWPDCSHIRNKTASPRSKGRVSELVTGKQRFNDEDLRAFSEAMNVTRGFLIEVNPLSEAGKTIAEPWRFKVRLPPPPPKAPEPKGDRKPGSKKEKP